ncbi:MAG: DUF1554 domain-containing protein [Leptospirales bacterium]
MNNIKKYSFYTSIVFLILLFVGCSGMLDIPGPKVSVTSSTGGYSVNEKDGTLDITIAVGIQPTGDVTLSLSSSDTGEFTVSTSSLTFTSSNWTEAQTVTLTGVDELITDGNQDTTLNFAEISSTDKSFDGYTQASLDILVVDNETDSIAVSPVKGLSTTESGTGAGACTGANDTATFTVVLGSQPVASFTVTVPVVTDNPDEGNVTTPAGGVLTFTDADYDVPQTVIVTCEDDNILDGSVPYGITVGPASSTEGVYDAMNGDTVAITNNDNETASIVVTPVILNLVEGGATGSFTVTLNNAPTGPAKFAITSADETRATIETPIPGGELIFVTNPVGGYPHTQTVIVTPVDYDDIDDDIAHVVMVEIGPADANYQNENPPDVTVNITDGDTAGVSVSNLSGNTSDDIARLPRSRTFIVTLDSQPTADVTILINETDDLKNDNNVVGTITGDPKTLTFLANPADPNDPERWNKDHTVTVNGVADEIDDEDLQYIIKLEPCVSSDSNYNGLLPIGVTVNHKDWHTAGITITGSGLVTDDMGNLDKTVYSTFTVKLNSQPTADVIFDLASSNDLDGTPDKSVLTFNSTKDTTNSWNVEQTVTVHITNNSNNGGTSPDHVNEGNHRYFINLTKRATADAKYDALGDPSVALQSCDNDGVNKIIGCSTGATTSEGGGSGTVWFITQQAPTNDITVPVASLDLGEGTIDTSLSPPNIRTITSGNWNTMLGGTNRVVVNGVDDGIFDGNVQYTLDITAVTSVDGYFSAYDPVNFLIRNVDNEQALVFTAVSGNTTEGGVTATFDVKIGMAPTSDVTFTLACSDVSECASVSPATLTFTAANSWQTVTITGLNDNEADGNVSNPVTFGAFDTLDEVLNAIVPPSYGGILNEDDDKRIWVTASTFLGNFNITDLNSMSNMDDYCTNDANNPGGGTYKALVAHSVHRVATTDGSTTAGQTNWVLAPSTQYYTGAGFTTRVFTTNSNSLVSFPFANSLTGGPSWTGFTNNWQTSADNCGDWFVSNEPAGLSQTGVGGVTDSSAISGTTASCFVTDNIWQSLICVQQ